VKNTLTSLGVVLLLFVLSGCRLPKEPGKSSVRKKGTEGNLTYYVMNPGAAAQKSRDLLIVSYDDQVQGEFSDKLTSYYNGKSVRFEDLAFWKMVKNLRYMYRRVFILPWNRISPASLSEAFLQMESHGSGWDTLLMLHGLPNRLIGTSPDLLPPGMTEHGGITDSDAGSGHITYKHLESLKGKLAHLRLVFLEACWGNTLAADFQDMGAEHVISFSGMHTNFFYAHYLMYYLRKNQESVPDSYELTNQKFRSKIRKSLTFSWLIKQMGLKVNSYLGELRDPVLLSESS